MRNRAVAVMYLILLVGLSWVNFFPKVVECDSVGEAFGLWWEMMRELSFMLVHGEDPRPDNERW